MFRHFTSNEPILLTVHGTGGHSQKVVDFFLAVIYLQFLIREMFLEDGLWLKMVNGEMVGITRDVYCVFKLITFPFTPHNREDCSFVNSTTQLVLFRLHPLAYSHEKIKL
ncbi:hypothetical protein Bhyg_13617 [Pseudolycoriella hygida]|uniref:Uncharacterized protein n=1 Tax=Pseudolycoriella hygida TaxID=35572 RepID=A0A9Q0RUV3_9DIPT|nr:hypothetical protein Bhyg_13617 [Pseudolycoriella hygida]